jgi:hypothetical protein
MSVSSRGDRGDSGTPAFSVGMRIRRYALGTSYTFAAHRYPKVLRRLIFCQFLSKMSNTWTWKNKELSPDAANNNTSSGKNYAN